MLNIFLDLDETLIHSIKIKNLGVDSIEQKTFKKGTVPPHSRGNKKLALQISKYKWTATEKYIICHRPYLDIFLKILSSKYNINIWTAASVEYMIKVINILDLKNLGLLLYNKHCPKNLNKLKSLGYSLKNTYIIDDLKEVKNLQYNNCLLIKPFLAKLEQENDVELLKMIIKLNNL